MSSAASNRDLLLIRSALGGNERSFRQLHERHGQGMARVVSSIVDDRDAADDCLQEVWTLVIQKGGTFRGQARLSTWLYRLTRNHAISFVRRQRARAKHVDRLEGMGRPEWPDHATSSGDVLLRGRLARLLLRLPDAKREILLLHDLHDLTHEEIARRLGIRPGTSRSQLHKARRMMRAMLDSTRRAA